MASEVSPDIQNFWVPVAQIVPVFALALVFEVRRIAPSWRSESLRRRRMQSVFFLVIAAILGTAESVALGHMLRATTGISPYVVAIALLIAVVLLATQPVISLAVAANIDLLAMMSRILPNSRWRTERKEVAAYKSELFAIVNRWFENHEEISRLRAQTKTIRGRIAALRREIAEGGEGAVLGRLDEHERAQVLAAGGLIPYLDQIDFENTCNRKNLGKSRRTNEKSLRQITNSIKAVEEFEARLRLSAFTDDEQAEFQRMLDVELSLDHPDAIRRKVEETASSAQI